MRKSLTVAAALALLALAAPADARVRAGVLECTVSPGVGFLIGSQKSVACVYKSNFGFYERYTGTMSRAGFDVGYTSGGAFAWIVYAPARPGPGALAGGYAGASGEATVGAGLSANALVGGFENSITLQPLSVGAQRGLSAAIGISGLSLAFAPQ